MAYAKLEQVGERVQPDPEDIRKEKLKQKRASLEGYFKANKVS